MPVSGMYSMTRVNRGRHVIIETVTHAKLKEMCNEAGVLLTTICDATLRATVFELMKMPPADRTKLLQEIAGGMALGKAFEPFAELIKLASEGGTIVDKTGEGEKGVTPEKGEGPTQGHPQ
jgi:hypothetical protein